MLNPRAKHKLEKYISSNMIKVSMQKCWHDQPVKLVIILSALGIRSPHDSQSFAIWR
jgi:hypothetical protein